jgi:hypothetical protein
MDFRVFPFEIEVALAGFTFLTKKLSEHLIFPQHLIMIFLLCTRFCFTFFGDRLSDPILSLRAVSAPSKSKADIS